MTATKTITNEDLLETMQTLMQMTSDGFEHLDKRMGKLEERMDRLETRVSEIERRLSEHDVQFIEIKQVLRSIESHHAAYINDIEDILDRLQILEERMPNLTAQELTDLHS